MAKKKKQSIATWTFDDLGNQLLRQLAAIMETLQPYRQEIGSSVIFLISLLVVLNLLGLTGGAIPNAVGNLAAGLFGWGAIPVVTLLGALSVFVVMQVFRETPAEIPMERVIGVELIVIGALVAMHYITPAEDRLLLAHNQGGGGYVGWGLGSLVFGFLGRWGTVGLFSVIALTGIGLIISANDEDIRRFSQSFAPKMPEMPKRPLPVAPVASPPITTSAPPAPAPTPVPPKPASPPKPAAPAPRPAMNTDQARQAAVASPSYALPPIDLLAPSSGPTGRAANARHQAELIEETLNSFGVPAKVVEINPGPTVTQFGVKPGKIVRKMSDGTVREQRVRVSKINSLINDLALALSAAPIRIETPVPGRPIVGIEVPNTAVAMVSLRTSMESDKYQKAKGKLPVVLGRGVGGSVAVIDLTQQPHMLIAGATGSGKSVCINSTIINLLMTHTPDELKLLMIDPKMVELTSYNGIPHLIAPVVTDFEQVAGALAWVTREMERRYKAFAQLGARNISTYNQRMPKGEKMPFMVVIIDELADLMMLAADEVEKYIARIAQMARATGIHMIIATQRPSTDVVTGLIKANFPARIAFAVSSQIDSRVIIDSPGADKLLGKGDMLYVAPDSPKMARLQGCFVSDAEIKNVVQYWKWAGGNTESTATTSSSGRGIDLPASGTMARPAGSSGGMNTPANNSTATDNSELPWAGILEEERKDDMMQRAIDLVVSTNRASTSYLQRKLGIGYPRASRLMDDLEDEGVVSPPDHRGARTVIWKPESLQTTESAETPTPASATQTPHVSAAPSPPSSAAIDTEDEPDLDIDDFDDFDDDDY